MADLFGSIGCHHSSIEKSSVPHLTSHECHPSFTLRQLNLNPGRRKPSNLYHK